MAALAVVIAFCSASQDIVFDAWKTDVLPAEERGAGAAISVLGYRLGMLVSGGLALWLADKWLGWQGMYWLMAASSLASRSFSVSMSSGFPFMAVLLLVDGRSGRTRRTPASLVFQPL